MGRIGADVLVKRHSASDKKFCTVNENEWGENVCKIKI